MHSSSNHWQVESDAQLSLVLVQVAKECNLALGLCACRQLCTGKLLLELLLNAGSEKVDVAILNMETVSETISPSDRQASHFDSP